MENFRPKILNLILADSITISPLNCIDHHNVFGTGVLYKQTIWYVSKHKDKFYNN
jgi:hypothetical protein